MAKNVDPSQPGCAYVEFKADILKPESFRSITFDGQIRRMIWSHAYSGNTQRNPIFRQSEHIKDAALKQLQCVSIFFNFNYINEQ